MLRLRDDSTRRMSASKWKDGIPRSWRSNIKDAAFIVGLVYDGSPYQESAPNCPALMGDPFPTYPDRWEEVPRTAYDPRERLKALDSDRVDAEVLFPNPPGGNYFEFGDAAFELDVVRAYNGEWARISDRYLPVAILPYQPTRRRLPGRSPALFQLAIAASMSSATSQRSPISPTRAGIRCGASARSWAFPSISTAQRALRAGASVRKWSGYTPRQAHSASTATSAVTPAQIIPQLIFSVLPVLPASKSACLPRPGDRRA